MPYRDEDTGLTLPKSLISAAANAESAVAGPRAAALAGTSVPPADTPLLREAAQTIAAAAAPAALYQSADPTAPNYLDPRMLVRILSTGLPSGPCLPAPFTNVQPARDAERFDQQ